MHRTYGIDYRRSLWYALCLAGLLCIWLYSSTLVYAASVPGGNISDSAVRGADIARPAVMRIITTITARLTVNFPPTTSVTLPQQANSSYSLSFSGTGAFITSQGDILTADHVVRPPQDATLNADLYSVAAADIAKYENSQPGASQVTKDQVTQQLTSGQLASTPTYGSPTSEAFLSTDYTGSLTAPDLQSLPDGVALKVDQIKQESPTDQADTAIIHVPMQDTPAVPLEKSTDVQALDQLTIIGFPGDADTSTKPNDLFTSSLNTVQVSSKKSNSSGASLIQVSGNVGHGDSGGPALNSDGQIVGIVSYGQTDQDSGGAAIFLQASQTAQTMVDTLKLNTTPGAFQQTWSQGFQDYAATTTGHWTRAKQAFDLLAQKYPLFKAVQPYQQYATQQAQTEAASTPVPTATAQATATMLATPTPTQTQPSTSHASLPAILLAVGGVLAVILLATLLFAVIVRPRGKKQAARMAKKANATRNAKSNQDGKAAEKVSKPQTGGSVTPAPNQPATSTPANQSAPAQASTNQPALAQPDVPASTQRPVPAPSPVGQQTLALKIWPCGHMNRPTARFCSVCGEAAPSSPTSTTLH